MADMKVSGGSTATPSKIEKPTSKPAGDAKPAGKTSTAGGGVKTPTDKTTVSKPGDLKDDPRAKKVTEGLGDAYGASAVKADTWKKGPNDTIEGMLKGKGFSLKDIYSKGPNGQNMVDRVLSANNLKDARKMQDGQEMIIPDLGKKGGGTATSGLKPGEKTEAKTIGDHKIQSEKLPDGTNQSSVDTKNGTGVQVQSPGNSTNATQVKPDGTTSTQTLAKDAQGKVTTQVDTTTKGSKDTIEAKTLDGGTLKGTASPDGVQLANGDVKIKENLDERKRDGFFENVGSTVDGWLGNAPAPTKGVEVQGKQVTTVAEGNDITVSADNKPVAKFNQDADDSFVERTGAVVDKGVQVVGDLANQAGTVISNAASGAVDLATQAGGAISNAAGGLWNWMTGG